MIKKIKQRDINFPKGTLPQSPRTSPPAHQVLLFSVQYGTASQRKWSTKNMEIKEPTWSTGSRVLAQTPHVLCSADASATHTTPRRGRRGSKLGHCAPLIKQAPERGFLWWISLPQGPWQQFFIKSKKMLSNIQSARFSRHKNTSILGRFRGSANCM